MSVLDLLKRPFAKNEILLAVVFGAFVLKLVAIEKTTSALWKFVARDRFTKFPNILGGKLQFAAIQGNVPKNVEIGITALPALSV